MRPEQEYIPRRTTASDLDINVLLTQYGQAMARVGQLEQQVAELQSRLQAAVAASKPQPAAQPPPDIEAKLRQKDATIETLRLQLMTSQSELARTKEKLKLAAEGAYMRHRHHRKWWQFWKK